MMTQHLMTGNNLRLLCIKHQNLIASQLRMAAQWCTQVGSPLYTTLLNQAARDVEQGGPCWAVLQRQEAAPLGSAMPLRFMGAVHRLVLQGSAPSLARFYPSVGGDATLDGAWTAFRGTIEEHCETLRELLLRPVQTNEVGRCAALLGGFLLIAREIGPPLCLLELGASAGLNLRWDYYYYEVGKASWGNSDSPVRLANNFREGLPPFDVEACVVERRGCDLNPLNPSLDEDRLTLFSFVLPDQTHRFELLRGALDIARQVAAIVDKADAAEWLSAQLDEPRAGVATVVFHSLVMPYLSQAGQDEIQTVLKNAGARATESAPLAWLRMEPGDNEVEVDMSLTTWPAGDRRLLATATDFGREVRWLLT